MRPRGGDFWILKIAQAPSPKNLSINGFRPRKGVAFLWKAFLQKNFQGREKIPRSGYPEEATPTVQCRPRPPVGLFKCKALGLDLRPPASYSCSVLREAGLSLEDLGPRLKTCQRGSLGGRPVSGGGLTSQRQDLVFSCFAPFIAEACS
jgi:hypothetical protein